MNNKPQLFTGLSHIGLPTEQLENTVQFYQQFGFQIDWSIKKSETDSTVFLKCGSCVIETYYSEHAAMKNGAIDHIALDVSDIQCAYDYVSSLGYQSLEGQITYLPFYNNGVRYFTILGPNHEKLEFSQRL